MRRVRIALTVAGGVALLVAVVVAIALQMHGRASDRWTEFSIGPPAGSTFSMGSHRLHSNGASLKFVLAAAYDVPTVRVIGPSWLAMRYSIKAAVRPEETENFQVLLREELNHRLSLQTHFEVRPFDIFVLTASPAPRLVRGNGEGSSTRIDAGTLRFKDATMAVVASNLQSVLQKPVIDETGITGLYDLELQWGEDRVADVTSALRDRYGLVLSPGKREMHALIVDRVRRDTSLVVLDLIGRVTRNAPRKIREHVAEAIEIH